MPPRTAKKASAPGSKRTVRVTKKAKNQTVAAGDSPAKVEETPAVVEATQEPAVEAKKVAVADVKQEPVAEMKQVAVAEVKQEAVDEVTPGIEVVDVEDEDPVVSPPERTEVEAKAEVNPAIAVKKEDHVKESVDEYENGERLDLDDNDYEPEEDYDEKEMEQEDLQEEGDEVEEEIEEGDGGEDEEGDVIEEEVEEIPEEVEADEGEEHAANGEEHAEMADEDEEEHHEVVNERRKRKEFEVFVGGLDKDATEDDLKRVFGEVGEIIEVRLMINSQTKKNKGFAFLRFATVEQAKRAVTELKNPMVNGKQCGVTPSQDSDTLFLGNICKTWTKEALKDKLKNYGVENIDDITLVEDSNNDGMNRGFAFLEFSSRSDAMDAFKRLHKRGVTFGVDRTAKVSFADAFVDPGDEIMAQVKTVFVDGVPASWDEDRVRRLLKKYGAVEKIELARNMPSAKRKDFGFVTFDSHDAAVTCAKSINNAELGEGDSKAKVRARLSRPLQRGKGKHAIRGELRPGAAGRNARAPWSRPVPRPMPRSLPSRGARGLGGRVPPTIDRGLRRPVGFRDRRPPVALPVRSRPLPPSRSYDRRVPVPSYPKKKDYGSRDELPPRNRSAADYGSRAIPERRSSFRDQYADRGSGYPELPRSTSRALARRNYIDDGYGQRFDKPPTGYRDGRPRDYDSISGSKRPYTTMDDVPPNYADAGGRHARARYDYDLGGSSSQYSDAYSDRLGRSNLGYGSSRSSIPSQDPHGLYSSRQGMSYGGGSFSGGGDGGMYSSGFTSDYASRGTDVGGSSYSSLYSSRRMGGSNYMGSSGSRSYY